VRVAAALAFGASVLLPCAAFAESGAWTIGSAEGHLARHPYDYQSRQKLVGGCRESGDLTAAYYHAAWLAWLASREYADSDAGSALLRNREMRDRAAREQGSSGIAVILSAVDAKQLIAASSLNGTIAQQAARLSHEIADLLARAEQIESEERRQDPVVRIALAQIALSLDDALYLDRADRSRRSRLLILRTAAGRAASVAAWLPDAPGPHRLLATIRARMAELDNRSELWSMAIEEAERARALDPADQALAEMLWVLNLRAANWQAARTWQAVADAAISGRGAE
jgi:hypothetical protein